MDGRVFFMSPFLPPPFLFINLFINSFIFMIIKRELKCRPRMLLVFLASPGCAGETTTSQSDIKMINEPQKYRFYGRVESRRRGWEKLPEPCFFFFLSFAFFVWEEGHFVWKQTERKVRKRSEVTALVCKMKLRLMVGKCRKQIHTSSFPVNIQAYKAYKVVWVD